MLLLAIGLLSFVSGILFSWLGYKVILSKNVVPADQLELLKIELQQLQLKHAAEISKLLAEIKFSEEKLQIQQTNFEQLGAAFETKFKTLAQTILDEKAEKLSAVQNNNLKAVLEPLKEQIKTFSHDYELKRMKESEERVSLREQVRQMMELNKTLSEKAESLTAALRGNIKQQGNWGEMILESILEYAGLQRNVQYFTQVQATNAEGKTIQPDIIVRYPGGRAIVIDAKVSLTHYEQYVIAAGKNEQDAAQKLIVKSFRSHIDGLSSKSYQDVGTALDFVMMFVPVEGAYIAAIQSDQSLWQYAYNKKILLISPTNLIAAMKLVADMWQRENINKEAHRIAEKAGKLYDKLVLFVENFEKVGAQLAKAQGCWQDAYKQLSSGKNNLISQAEQMKTFNAKASKSLPANLIEEALLEDQQSILDG